MPRDQTKSNLRRNGRQSSVLKLQANEGKRPRGVERKQPIRKSKRLQTLQRKTPERKTLLPSPSATNSFGEDACPGGHPKLSNEGCLESKLPRDSPAAEKAPNPGRKRKRSYDPENAVLGSSLTPPPKRPQTLPPSCAVEDTSYQKAKTDIDKKTHPITHWIRERSWPKEYSEQDNQTKEGLKRYTCLEDFTGKQMMADILAKKKSSSSLRRKDSEPSLTTASDQQPREAKSSKYMNASYETVLAAKGSYMGRAPLAITDTSKTLCRSLLLKEQIVPQETLFRDDLFEETCDSVRGRNEAMVVRHISPLICPSPLVLRIDGAKDLDFLIESVNEGWNSAIAIVYSRPQPDYSVGFARSAFTDEQLEKLRPFVGEIEDFYTSYFMGTWRMYFPFLTCEVKCGAASLDVADRQNAHSMTIAVRSVVKLYRHVKREKEIHREILAFSISHDDEAVRIFGHYPVIDGDNTTFYRHPIKAYDFTSEEGKEKWTAYKFTKNIYEVWMPTHIKRIRSAIDDLPSGINFEVPPGDSFTSVASADESEQVDSQEMATSAPSSQNTVGFKKPKLPPKVILQKEVEQLNNNLAQEREQSNQRLTELMKQMAQEREESKQRHKELTEQNKELMGMLKQRIT